MRSIFIVTLCFVCINLATPEVILANRIENVSKESEMITEPQNATAKKMTFMQLNWYCYRLILEELDLYELLALTKAEKKFKFIVGEILRRKFAKKKVMFVFVKEPFSPKYTETNAKEYSSRFLIRHLELIAELLENFGHLIQRLITHYDDEFTEDDVRIYFNSINIHCSKTLKRLYIASRHDIFRFFEKPFENVEKISLKGIYNRLSNSNLTFSQLFPCVRSMSLNINFDEDDWLDQTFEHLEHLKVFISSDETKSKFNGTILKRLIQSNSHQIRNLTLRFVTPKLLQMIAHELPNLENLKLIDYHETHPGDTNIALNFQQLKRISVRNSEPTVPTRMIFGNLVEFETNGYSMDWIDFIQREKSLQRIQIDRWLHEFEVLKLANVKSNLSEIQIFPDEYIKVEILILMIENHRNLTRIRLKTQSPEPWNSAFEELQKRLQNEWTIGNDIPYFIQLKRIEPN